MSCCRCRCTGWRFFSRRFNQSAELARAIAALSGKPFAPNAIMRVKMTRQQVGLGVSERQDNVRAAFRVPPESDIDVRGRRVLLVDDVYTTGATVSSVSKALKKSGAAAVDVLTFARVLPGDFNDADRGKGLSATTRPYIVGEGQEGWRNGHGGRDDLHTDDVRLLHRRQAAARAQGRGLHRARRELFAGAAAGNDRRVRTAAAPFRRYSSASYHVGGSDDLHELERQGKLDGLIASGHMN